jgi:hypothetical protein
MNCPSPGFVCPQPISPTPCSPHEHSESHRLPTRPRPHDGQPGPRHGNGQEEGLPDHSLHHHSSNQEHCRRPTTRPTVDVAKRTADAAAHQEERRPLHDARPRPPGLMLSPRARAGKCTGSADAETRKDPMRRTFTVASPRLQPRIGANRGPVAKNKSTPPAKGSNTHRTVEAGRASPYSATSPTRHSCKPRRKDRTATIPPTTPGRR